MKYKQSIFKGHELIYSADWIWKIESQVHWIYYWHQASLVWSLVPKTEKLLEIGVGSSFLSNYLKSKNWDVTTLDIDEDKSPDLVGNIAEFDLSKLPFDVVLAFEIFEHLPYPVFEEAVDNLLRQHPKEIIFSVPWSKIPILEFKLKFPKFRPIQFQVLLNKKKITTPAHFWELKKSGSPRPEVIEQGMKGTVPEARLHQLFWEHGYHLKKIERVGYIQFFVAERRAEEGQ